MNLQRTVLNWRWWCVLPLAAVVIVLGLATMACEWIEPKFHAANRWQKGGWR